jgi:anti-sigma regulatory factor (Ser/Thr protein kinase)
VTVLDPPERGTIVRYPISEDLAFLRGRVHDYLASLGFDERRRMDFVLAVNEAMGNVLDHANASGTLALHHDTKQVVAEVVDTAGLLTDPDAGKTTPPPGARRGYGLWLIRQLCDDVQILHSEGLSCVRLQMTLPR